MIWDAFENYVFIYGKKFCLVFVISKEKGIRNNDDLLVNIINFYRYMLCLFLGGYLRLYFFFFIR